MMRKISVIAGLLLSGLLFAGLPPAQISFEEGEQFDLSLSRLNFNRIFVAGEKIVQVRFPAGTFTVDKRDLEEKEDSVYIKPVYDAALTVFFATNKGHHFSLTVKPDETPGKTVRLLSNTIKPAVHWEKKADVRPETEGVMQSMMSGLIPKDFYVKAINPRAFYVQKTLKVSLVKCYQGARLQGYVYQIENKASKDAELTTALFANNKAVSLALSTDKLAPHETAYLYGLYKGEPNA